MVWGPSPIKAHMPLAYSDYQDFAARAVPVAQQVADALATIMFRARTLDHAALSREELEQLQELAHDYSVMLDRVVQLQRVEDSTYTVRSVDNLIEGLNITAARYMVELDDLRELNTQLATAHRLANCDQPERARKTGLIK